MSPIREELRHFYEGEAWQRTRRMVLRRAEDKCECLGECGKHEKYRCARPNRSDYRNARGVMVRVVLEVAHRNHESGDDRLENLAALCAECHLGHDHEFHLRNAAATRREKKQNLELFE